MRNYRRIYLKIVYNGNQFPKEPPEVKCVRRYLQSHNIDHIPVDVDVRQNLSDSDVDYMLDSFEKYNVYNNLIHEQYELTFENGYAFLNSQRSEELFTQKRIIEQNLLQFIINKDRLSRIRKSFYEQQDVREHEIIKNIYKYSKQNPYNQGLLLIGSGASKRYF